MGGFELCNCQIESLHGRDLGLGWHAKSADNAADAIFSNSKLRNMDLVRARGEKATIEKLTTTLKTHAVDEDVSFT